MRHQTGFEHGTIKKAVIRIGGWTRVRSTAKMARVKSYPLKFRPIAKERIWGGQKRRGVFGKDLPPGEKIGENRYSAFGASQC